MLILPNEIVFVQLYNIALKMRYLFVLDFDETIAHTFEPSPNKLDVAKSYSLAVREVLTEVGLGIYNEQGGLQNRAPQELVYDILASASDTQREIILYAAEKFLEANRDGLQGLVPKGKGAPLIWSDDSVSTVSELLVRAKLSYTLGEIGDEWPRPTKGFLDFYRSVDEHCDEDVAIDFAVVSSGHDLFIEKTFDTWGLKRPGILVTEDEIRGLKFPKEVERRVKPSAFPLALAHFKWMRKNRMMTDENIRDRGEKTKPRIVFIGDDPKKDGGMAERSGILFGRFGEQFTLSPGMRPNSFIFGDWGELKRKVHSAKEQMAQGLGFHEIILGGRRIYPERV